MELRERYRIVLDSIVSHESPGKGDDGPRMFNLFIRDRVSNATLNAFLVGSQTAVQAVVAQGDFLQFARLTDGADNVFSVLVAEMLMERGVQGLTPYVSLVQEIRPLKPPKPM